jgi:ABC-type oligopeptide transport system substrate-binding subunit
VVIKLAFPFRSVLEMFAYHTFFWVVPKEAEQFNIKGEARGSGPFFLQEWQPSRAMIYTKNPDWYTRHQPGRLPERPRPV